MLSDNAQQLVKALHHKDGYGIPYSYYIFLLGTLDKESARIVDWFVESTDDRAYITEESYVGLLDRITTR